jgi:hypothetical protein
MAKFIDIAIDLETFSTKPNAMMAVLGAAARDDSGELVIFEMAVSSSSWHAKQLDIDPDTVKWWLQQSQEARNAVTAPSGTILYKVCESFNSWVTGIQGGPDAHVRVWGNAAAFDNVILRKNYEVAGVAPVWGYRSDMCYRTLKNLYPSIPKVEPDFPHVASSDAIAQLLHLEMILNHMENLEHGQ